MFQFPGLPSHGLLFRPWMTTLFRVAGFPHSDTHGSLTVYVSPWRFAVCRVLLLLHMPRHPPYALLRLITRELFNLVSFNLTSVFFLFDYSEKLHICLFCVFRFSKNPLPQKLPRSHLRKPDRRLGRFCRVRVYTALSFCSIVFLLRKEVIHPHVLVGIPCYDLTPITRPTFDGSLLCGLGHRLRVLPALMV